MSRVEPLDVDIGTLAWLAGGAANEHLLRAIRSRGHEHLRISHGFVFQHLIEGSPTVSDLAESLGVTQQAASKVVAELDALGYVERVVDPDDSRVRRVRLTRRGRRAVQVARDERRVLEAEVEALVGSDALDVAREVLATLLDHAGGMDAVANRRVKPAT